MPRKVLTAAAREPQDGAIQVEVSLPVRQRRDETGRHRDSAAPTGPQPRIPRITRLMALAIKFQEMVDRGEVRDYADLARLGLVTRARLTQIMNMLLLVPDIQSSLILREQNPVQLADLNERALRTLTSEAAWASQRTMWRRLMAQA